nr:unnamed protein product [Spirometra erinaceieuropaei]
MVKCEDCCSVIVIDIANAILKDFECLRDSESKSGHAGFQTDGVCSKLIFITQCIRELAVATGNRRLFNLLTSLRDLTYRPACVNEIDKPVDRLFAMARKVSVSKLKRILQELLILFSRLHSGNGEPVSSKPLTDSFGWNGEEVFVHQDVQELNRLLFEQIEIALKNTGQENLINDLYHGVLRTRVKCLVCGRVSERNDDFLDVNLSVSDWDSVEDSLRAHTQTERLCGDNQYFCERCQCRVDASKQTFEAKIVNQTNTNSSCTRDRGGLTDCRRGRYVFSNNRVARQDTLLPRRSLSLARTFGDPDKLPGRSAAQQTVFPVGLMDSGNHATTSVCRRQAMFARRGCQKPGVGTTGQPLRVSHLLGIWSSSSNKGSDVDFGTSPQPPLQPSLSQREIPSANGSKCRKSHSAVRHILPTTSADTVAPCQSAHQGERLADRMKVMCLGFQKASPEAAPKNRSRRCGPEEPRIHSPSSRQSKLPATPAQRSFPRGGTHARRPRYVNSRAPPASIITSPELSDRDVLTLQTHEKGSHPSLNCPSSDLEFCARKDHPKVLTTSHNNDDNQVIREASNEHFDHTIRRTTIWRSRLFAQTTPEIEEDVNQDVLHLQRPHQSHESTIFLQDISDRSDTAASSGQEEVVHAGKAKRYMPSRGLKMKDSLSINFGMASINKGRRIRNQGNNSENIRTAANNISNAGSADSVTPPPADNVLGSIEYGRWFDFNDDVVTEVDITAFSGVFKGPECAYMLFYKVNRNPI